MSSGMTRRKMLTTGIAAVAGVAGLAVADRIAGRYGLIPPDSGGIFGPGETLTYAAQRVLMARHPLAREFGRSDVSKIVPVSGPAPQTEAYDKFKFGQFADWRIAVDGLVARPTVLSLADLLRMPPATQITHQQCEEGWSFIAEWTGVRLSTVLNQVGVSANAKYVFYFSIQDNWFDSLDMPEAWHPQTMLTYALNGEPLPPDHGAPVRMKVPRQLGYKSVKFLTRITVTDSAKGIGDGTGSGNPPTGYSWYAGI